MATAETVRSILKAKGTSIWSLGPEATVYDAVAMMADKRVGALLVMDSGKLLGIISERDYARKVILLGRSSRETPVREIMTSPVITVTPDDSVDDCMKIVTESRVRHLPVMEGGEIAGMISIGDLVRAIIASHEHTIGQLSAYISGGYPS